MAKRRKWLCLDCKVDTGKISEHYFIRTETWMELTQSQQGMLCIGCLEVRLGRKLQSSDFTKCHINDPKLYSKSIRLLERMNA